VSTDKPSTSRTITTSRERSAAAATRASAASALRIPPPSDEAALPDTGRIEMLLVMTVVPGFRRHAFMEADTMPMVAAAHDFREERGLSFHIGVDSGIDWRTVTVAHGTCGMVPSTNLYDPEDMAEADAAMRG
jgi:ribulose-phosphate 3-epimerase